MPEPGDDRVFRGPDGITVTQLELRAQALIAAIQAWTYPADPNVRQSAVIACSQLDGMDYLGTVASVVENLIPATVPLDQAMTAGRWAVVDHLLNSVYELTQAGIMPRDTVSQRGLPVDDLGNELEGEGDYV